MERRGGVEAAPGGGEGEMEATGSERRGEVRPPDPDLDRGRGEGRAVVGRGSGASRGGVGCVGARVRGLRGGSGPVEASWATWPSRGGGCFLFSCLFFICSFFYFQFIKLPLVPNLYLPIN